jgi:hypothetical protein
VITVALWHLGRLRRSEDRDFLRPGLCDALLINANQLENNPEGTAGYLEATHLPYLVDPMLWRLQVPAWWRNERGDVKRNYARLASRYAEGTDVRMAEAPLLECVHEDGEWRLLAQNIVAYQRGRLCEQLDLFNAEGVRPQAVIAPALVASSPEEDRLNRLLAEAAAEAAGEPVYVTFVLPIDRLARPAEVRRALGEVPTDDVAGFFIWTPGVLEDVLISEADIFGGLVTVVGDLASRGRPVVHLHGSYTTAALRRFGVAGVVHHLGWVDKGEPSGEQSTAIRSCRTYAPVVRHSILFDEAATLARSLDEVEYLSRYCDCGFCAGAFQVGQHPLDLMLEDQPVTSAQRRRMPTSRATSANTWHYLHARRQEVDVFGAEPALDVVQRDIERAATLVGRAPELERLAAQLRTA